MRQIATQLAVAAVLLASLATALPHGDDESLDMDMDMNMGMDSHASDSAAQPATSTAAAYSEGPMSYFAYGKHSTTIMAHIALMILGWCFVLPAGKRISSR